MNRSFKSRIVLGFAAALGLTMLATGADAAPTVSANFDSSAELKGSVRYRNLVNNTGSGIREIRVGDGVDSTGAPTNPAEGDVIWPTSQSVSINYNTATNRLRTQVGTVTVEKPVNFGSQVNYLQIRIVRNSTDTTVNLNNVSLQTSASYNLGNFLGSANPTQWKVTGEDLQNGFTLNGTLALASLGGGVDANYVQIDVGYVAPSDNQAPVVRDLGVTPVPVIINGEAAIRATVDDSGTGNNNIQSAYYSLNGVGWSAMSAKDGGFNSPVEAVEATFTARQIGENTFCVQGSDVLGNMSDGTACQTFKVDYNIDGFYSPIENNFRNIAKAGQTIPVKWRLTDYDGMPISDSTSFKGLWSYEINCTGNNQIGDPIEEYAAGSSGLQYMGDGYWQFNWKTPKDYANKCRVMYVQFNSGTEVAATFEFKK